MNSLGGAILRADLRGVVEEAFRQSQLFIGAKVMPPLPVPNRAGQYPVIKKNAGNLLRNEAKVRGAGATYPRITRQWENDNYTAQEYGIEALVDDSNREDLSRFFDLESTETRLAYRQVQLAHEIRVSSAIINTGTFSITTSATAFTLANRLGNGGFDLGLDVDTAKQAIQGRGEDATNLSLVMSLPVFNRVRGSTQVQNRVRGIQGNDSALVLDTASVAKALQVKQILIGAAAYDTSAQGASASVMSNIWPNTYAWLGAISEPTGPQDYFGGGTGFTLFWQQDSDIFQVESYREERARSEVIRARQYTAEKVVLAPSAQLIDLQWS